MLPQHPPGQFMQPQFLPAAMGPGDGASIDVRHLLRVVLQSWRSILGLCIVVSLLAALWVMRIAPVYSATATVMIETQQANTVSIDEVYAAPYRNYQYLMTQFEIIKNRDIAELAADALDLWNHPQFAPPPSGGDTSGDAEDAEETGGFTLDIRGWIAGLFSTSTDQPAPVFDAEELRRAAVINSVLGGLYVEPVEYTQLVKISFVSTDRKLAAEVANTVAQVYIQSQLDSKLASTREASTWLSSRLDDLKSDLEASQQELQAFRDQEQILDVDGGPGLDVQELNELSARLGEARRARMQAESVYRELGGAADYSVKELMNMPGVLQHPLVQSLAQSLTQAQQEVARLAKRYGPEHPTMMTAIAREESVEAEFEVQVLQVTQGMEKEYQRALRTEQEVEKQLAAVKQDVAQLNRKEFRLRELEQQLATDQRLYEMFFSRARETSENVGFQQAHARVVEKAVAPMSPFKPNKQRTVGIAFVLSALLGVALVILRDMLDNTLKSPDDVADRLHAPLLGTLPDIKMPKGHSGPYTGFMDDQTSSFSEAMRTIRTSLALSGLEKPHKITVVTSTTPGEGKSTAAINLAAALAQMESVLLIDADLRRPTVAGVFKLEKGCPGLSELLTGSCETEAAIYKTEHGFDVLPVGVIPANPQELISSARFKKIVRELAEQYDRVIIDSTPINAVSDSLILATLADSLVYVVKADSTPATVVQKNLTHIKNSNLPLTGIILNRLNAKNQPYYGKNGYYNGYYSYGQGKA
jgi:succinoglycan biosynthesis transport protein ExoP